MIQARSLLITGYPSLLAQHTAQAFLAQGFTGKLFLLSTTKAKRVAEKRLEALRPKRGATVQLLAGDVLDMHLGLQGNAFRALGDSVEEVVHLAEVSHPRATADQVQRVNVDGTRNLGDVLRELPKVRRLTYLSTAFVSGDRDGVIAEDEGDQGQRVLDLYAASKLEGERLVRRFPERVGVTVVRPSFIVGNSATGEVDRLEGPLYLAIRLALSAVPAIPITEGAHQPLHVVPVDHLARAIALLAAHPSAGGRTVHVADPNPMSLRRVYELVGQLTEKRVQILPLSRETTEAMLRLPFVETIFRPQRRGLGQAGQMVFYSQEGFVELLGSRLACPPLRSYVPKLIEGARRLLAENREARESDSLADEGI